MVKSLFFLIEFGRMDRGIIWTMWLIDHFSLFFLSLLTSLHCKGTGNSACGIWWSYLPTSPICQFRHVWHQYYIFIVFLTRGMEDLLVASIAEAADVVATPIIFGSLLVLYVFLYSASSSTDKRSLQSECTLFLLLLVGTDLSSSLSTLFTIVCVDVPLLLSEIKFHLQKMLATFLFNDQKGLNSLFHLLYFNVCVCVCVCVNILSECMLASSCSYF